MVHRTDTQVRYSVIYSLCLDICPLYNFKITKRIVVEHDLEPTKWNLFLWTKSPKSFCSLLVLILRIFSSFRYRKTQTSCKSLSSPSYMTRDTQKDSPYTGSRRNRKTTCDRHENPVSTWSSPYLSPQWGTGEYSTV